MKTVNAKIDSTQLGMEYHDIMTYHLSLDYGDSSHQGFGGFTLDGPYKENGEFVERRGSAYGMESIMQILKTVGVSHWEDLPGKHIRVKRDYQANNSRIIAIGHITKDKWFEPEEFGKRYFPEESDD